MTRESTKKLQRQIVFTKVPLKGAYRFFDEFQIFPFDLDIVPKSKYQRHFPNILEFWLDDSEKIKPPPEFETLTELFATTGGAGQKSSKLLALLTTFTNHRFFQYISTDFGSWGIPLLTEEPGEELNEQPPVWCMNLYTNLDYNKYYPKDMFTETTFLPVEKEIPYMKYFMYDPNIDREHREKEITFPDAIDFLFDAYFLLNEEAKNFIDTASLYNLSAVELYDYRKTLSLISSFTALETMINIEFKDVPVDKCNDCGQPKYSIRKKFREYLMKYLGASDKNKKKFNSYYDLRSKIIHTGQNIKTESLFNDVSTDESTDELVLRMEILQVGRLAVIKWLIDFYRVHYYYDAISKDVGTE